MFVCGIELQLAYHSVVYFTMQIYGLTFTESSHKFENNLTYIVWQLTLCYSVAAIVPWFKIHIKRFSMTLPESSLKFT